MQAERLLRRQVPPELVLLPHHQGEAPAIGVLALPGNVAHHAGVPPVGLITPESSLSVVVFARAVGARERRRTRPARHRQIDAAHRLHFAVLAAEQPAHRGPQPFLLLIDPVGLRESFDFDDRHDERLYESPPEPRQGGCRLQTVGCSLEGQRESRISGQPSAPPSSRSAASLSL